ncbi:hypothetical protein SAMN05518849_10839 [Sphingobium sp. AP50]|uniref:hypothetical protein n=1 Tax=Sphingobium sp. AP50 TaxID=1884369 RepID=UPI0008C5D65B|nr:hypothetical protein [Sphingobium sp. AP50]SEJ53163.1 hypothetical protein SAMN05518849_10839 [Sphingobium sp. AP50]
MVQWHEKLVARIGIRVIGLALLGTAWMEGLWLQDLMAAKPSADASLAQILLAALMFASVSLGLMLTIIGAGLWKPVQVSDRWTTSVPIPVVGDLEATLFSVYPTRHRDKSENIENMM